MFEKTKTSAKKFVAEHKFLVYNAAAAVTLLVVLQHKGLKQHDDFLKEHGLYEQFYNPEAAAGL